MDLLTKSQILDMGLTYPSRLVKLIPTKHFTKRLEERGIGLTCIPEYVRVTKDNIHSGKTKDGKRLKSVAIRLNYSTVYDLYLSFNPFDGALKTMWFRRKRNGDRKGTSEVRRQTV